ncbi:hypothetical protein [Hydrogenophaga sp.]|uniref:hypothetical protein n=1 Tax=Hydrogenophaga sp. TaxID=1904254 RepID=UPI003D0FD2C3
MEIKTFKARDVHPTVLRLPPEMRNELVRIANGKGVSLSKEITERLRNGLVHGVNTHLTPEQAVVVLAAHARNEAQEAELLTELDRAMLAVFRKMPVEKQLALLSLFR